MPPRPQILPRLVDLLISVERPHPLRVAIDGIDAAGKTALADELAPLVMAAGRPVIRASIDGFHRPKAIRYRRGPGSPLGYYHDSFDNEALATVLLHPLGPHGDLRYRQAVFDYRSDLPVQTPWQVARPDTILLFDGVFLLRPELNHYWDFRIFVEVDFEAALQRACLRDQERMGGEDEVLRRYRLRYYPAQRLYLQAVQPRHLADVIVDNNDLSAPTLRTTLASSL